MLFKERDATFSAECLDRASELYKLAAANEDFYFRNIPAATAFYKCAPPSPGLCWPCLRQRQAHRLLPPVQQRQGYAAGPARPGLRADQGAGAPKQRARLLSRRR
jgi:hypothetical protein